MQFQPVDGDGHCLYTAVSLYLGIDIEYLRQMVVQNIRSNMEVYSGIITAMNPGKTIENYLQAVEQSAEWADGLEIAVLMQVYRRPIVILDSLDGHIRNTSDYQRYQDKEPIFVYYNGHNHYDALILNRALEVSGRVILARLMARQEEQAQSVAPRTEEHKYEKTSSMAEHSEIVRQWRERQERSSRCPAPNPQEEDGENLSVGDWDDDEVSDAEPEVLDNAARVTP